MTWKQACRYRLPPRMIAPQPVRMPHHRLTGAPTANSGFTLIEAILALTLVLVLAYLSFAGLGLLRERAQEVQCQNHLRQAGTALGAYAADHNLRIHLFTYKTAGTSVSWLDYLSGHVTTSHSYSSKPVGPVYLENPDSALCPAFAPKRHSSDSRNLIYGSRERDPGDPAAFSMPGFSTSSANAIMSAIQSPASYWLLADSYHQTRKSQIYIVQRKKSSPGGMHFRHRGRANVLFADGHVAPMRYEEMKANHYNPVLNAYDGSGNAIDP